MINLNTIANVLKDPNIQRILTDVGIPAAQYLSEEFQKWRENRQALQREAHQWQNLGSYPYQNSSLKTLLEPKLRLNQNRFDKGLDTTLGELFDDPRAKALLNAQYSILSTDPLAPVMRKMTLNTIISMPEFSAWLGLTKDKAVAILAELNAE